MIPDVSPDHKSSKVFIDICKVSLEALDAFLVKSDFGIGMKSVVHNNSFNWSFEWNLNLSQFFSVTQDDILENMRFQIFIIDSNINFVGSENVLTSKVTGLSYSELFNGFVFVVFNYWFKDIYSTGTEPLVTPSLETEIWSH